MSAETQREIGDLLAGHLDAMQEDLRQRAQPYREIRDLLDKRDRAIQRAVALEGQNAALLRDVAEARDILRASSAIPMADQTLDLFHRINETQIVRPWQAWTLAAQLTGGAE